MCAEIEDSVVRSIMGIICEELYGDCRPFLVMENIIVDKNFRMMGIGQALFVELEKVTTQFDCTQILFVTESNRQDAISFYKSLGFKSDTHIGFKKSLNKLGVIDHSCPL